MEGSTKIQIYQTRALTALGWKAEPGRPVLSESFNLYSSSRGAATVLWVGWQSGGTPVGGTLQVLSIFSSDAVHQRALREPTCCTTVSVASIRISMLGKLSVSILIGHGWTCLNVDSQGWEETLQLWP